MIVRESVTPVFRSIPSSLPNRAAFTMYWCTGNRQLSEVLAKLIYPYFSKMRFWENHSRSRVWLPTTGLTVSRYCDHFDSDWLRSDSTSVLYNLLEVSVALCCDVLGSINLKFRLWIMMSGWYPQWRFDVSMFETVKTHGGHLFFSVSILPRMKKGSLQGTLLKNPLSLMFRGRKPNPIFFGFGSARRCCVHRQSVATQQVLSALKLYPNGFTQVILASHLANKPLDSIMSFFFQLQIKTFSSRFPSAAEWAS